MARWLSGEPLLKYSKYAMKILVACEYSGTTRDAFAAKGWDAWSCDLLPSDTPGNHYQGSVLDILDWGWDMMVAHPPCTYLSYAAKWCWDREGRAELRAQAMEFFMQMYNAPVPLVCVENPLGYPCEAFRKYDQIVHPYYFGDDAQKRTCLWLKGLPKLLWSKSDNLFDTKTSLDKPTPIYYDSDGYPRHFTDAAWSAHARSKSFPGIAQAMAEQWTEFYLSNQIQ